MGMDGRLKGVPGFGRQEIYNPVRPGSMCFCRSIWHACGHGSGSGSLYVVWVELKRTGVMVRRVLYIIT